MSFFEDTKKFIDFDTISYLVKKLRDENQRTYVNNSNLATNEDIDSIFVKPKKYLTIEALEDGLTVSLSMNACEYCIDEDGDWKTLNADTYTESINAGQTLSFRGSLIPSSSYNKEGIGTFTISKKCNVLGNVMSMLFGDDGKDSLSLSGKDYSFYKLFENCTNIISAKDLYLPATTLAKKCYSRMFYGCKSLTIAPILPATTLAESCYGNMFESCKSLTSAPELPATTVAKYCYWSMFFDCTSLTTAPAILPATTLAYACYNEMFSGCKSLTIAPILPAATLAEHCYYYMFNSCSKLNYIKMLATDISAKDCLYSWVQSVAWTGTFVKHPNMTSLPTGTKGIPEGWTVQDAEI